MQISKIVKLLLTGMFALALVSCGGDGPTAGKKGGAKMDGKRQQKATPVAVVVPVIQDARSFYETTAALEPTSDAQITNRTSGIVRKIYHEEGDDVAAGQVLLQLEDDDQKLRVKQARQKLENAKREYQRVKKMRASGVIANNEYDSAEIAYKTAQTDLELAQLALAYTQIKAPFSGRIVSRTVDLGASAAAGSPLFRMMAINPLLLRIHVPATRIGVVAKGDKVELKPDSVAQPVIGVVELVSPIVDPTTGTIKVTVALNNYPASVRPGDFTRVKLATDVHKSALMIPSVALVEEREDRYVFVASDGKAVKKKVDIGFIEADMTEIISGISESDKIIVKGQRSLADATPISVKEHATGKAMAEEKKKNQPRNKHKPSKNMARG